MPDSPTFSLITEPWIACARRDGSPTLVSLRDVFSGDESLASIRGDSPTQDYAIQRLILAIFWRAHAPEAQVEAGDTFSFSSWFKNQRKAALAGEEDRRTLDYLDTWAERFDLRHPTTPFMQVPDLHTTSNSTSAVSRIIPEAESPYFTMRAGAELNALDAAEAARRLVHLQAYDYSGIKSGAVGDPRVKGGKGYPIGTGWTGMTGGTLLLGSWLGETCVLNTSPDVFDNRETDLPPWEREPDTAQARLSEQPTGPVDLATWQSRRVRLFWEADNVVAVLVSNGDRIPDAGKNIMGDPMTPYRYSTNKSTSSIDVYYPRPYDTERLLWRSLEPLLAPTEEVTGLPKGAKASKRPKTLTSLANLNRHVSASDRAGIEVRLISASYGPQASSAATTTDARIGFPADLIDPRSKRARRTVFTAARSALDTSVALGSFGSTLRQAAGGEHAFHADAKNALLGDLEPEFTSWLRALDLSQLDRDAAAWQRTVRRACISRAQELIRGAGPKALIGRSVVQNEKERFISAGSAYATLLRKLRDILPDAYPDQLATSTPTTQEDTK